MSEILIFAGTTEGRLLAGHLAGAGVKSTVCVATDYGEAMLTPGGFLSVHTGRLDRGGMVRMMAAGGFAACVDATHPFATVASKEIRAAAEETGLPYLRLARETAFSGNDSPDRIVVVGSAEEAADYLDKTEGVILLTTGSKELPQITSRIRDKDRIYARVLPLADSLTQCEACGLKGRQIIAMQGPFTEDLNAAMMRQIGAKWMLTKQTGSIGGFAEKMRAAREAGARVVVIRNPESEESRRLTFGEVLDQLSAIIGVGLGSPDPEEAAVTETAAVGTAAAGTAADTQPAAGSEPGVSSEEKDGRTRSLILAGIGVGRADHMTGAVKEAVARADILFGAPRLLDSISAFVPEPACPRVPLYQGDKILDYLNNNPSFKRAVVAFSGDTGFYSGASSMMKAIRAAGKTADGSSPARGDEYEVEILCGISAPVYFASKIGEPWQDMTLLSAHGRGCNIIGHVRRDPKCFFLVEGLESVKRAGRELCEAEENGMLKDISVTYGYQLSYPEEKIEKVRPKDLAALTGEGLYVLLIENPHADETSVVPGVADEAFTRDKVPMTKEEIRSLSLCKLRPGKKAVVYDIGAGSGSVSVEAALLCPDGRVYAVEMKDLAVGLLEKNKTKFAVTNMSVIQAEAPAGLEDLPAPTHAFIGGSSGNMREILQVILAKNPNVRVVVNAVTLETLAEARNVLSDLGFVNTEYTQVQVSRAEALGRYHLMKSQNPVFIIAADGPGRRQQEL